MSGSLPPSPQIQVDTSVFALKYWFAQAQKWMNGTSKVQNVVATSSMTVPTDISFYAYQADTTSGAITFTLPPANGNIGKKFLFKHVAGSTNGCSINAFGTDTIDGASTYLINTLYDAVEIVSDGISNWIIISKVSSGGSSGSIPFFRSSGMTIPTVASMSVMGTLSSRTDKVDRLQVVKASAAANLAMTYTTPPATPYTVDVCGTVHGMPTTNEDALLGVGRSDGTKIEVCWGGVSTSSPVNMPIAVQKWNTTTGAVASPVNNLAALNPGLMYFRMTDDGTTLSYYYSNNGKDYYLVFSEPHNTFLTATRIGICYYNTTIIAAATPGKFSVYDYTVTPSILGDAS